MTSLLYNSCRVKILYSHDRNFCDEKKKEKKEGGGEEKKAMKRRVCTSSDINLPFDYIE